MQLCETPYYYYKMEKFETAKPITRKLSSFSTKTSVFKRSSF